MGFDLMENFRTPYRSASISEFWSRWHISLSSWFRDYLYIPLGGNRVKRARWYFNLLFVFLVSGLWHGANWTFVIWGGLHGTYLVLALVFAPFWAALYERLRWRPWRWAQVFVTFHLVVLGWVFFRASDVHDAFLALRKMPAAFSNPMPNVMKEMGPAYTALTLVLALLFLVIDPWMDDLVKHRRTPLARNTSVALYGGLAATILLFGYFGKTAFIYFQF
jgi:D-alanyl-lipoteichoic acid acyltransferase DltB (MBOAT superfamily)